MRSRKTFINITTSLLLQLVVLICGFIVPKLIITNYGSKVNGLVASITQFLAYITLLESGFGPVVKAALYKPIANRDKKQIASILKASEKFFRVIACIFLVYLLLLSVVYPLIINTEFDFVYTMSLVLILSISTFAEYYFGMTYKLFLQAEQKRYITSIVHLVGTIINTISIVILVRIHASIHIVKLVSSFIFVLRPIFQNIYVKRKYNINLKEADKNYKLEQKWDALAQHIAYIIHRNTDIAILTIFAPLVEVSVYSVHHAISGRITSIIQAFTGGADASFGDMIARGEKEQLNKSFSIYELFYFTLTTIAYTCTLLLIVQFIRVYMRGVTDANYIRPLFGTLLVLGEFVWAVREPYNLIILAAGHFKQIKKGAWVEAFVNIIISIALVWKYGIVGVAIGTLVAMTIRTIEFMYRTNRYILERKQNSSIKRVGLIVIEVMLVVMLTKVLPNIEMTSYINWIKYALLIAVESMIIVVPVNIIIYRKDAKGLWNIVKRNLVKKKA